MYSEKKVGKFSSEFCNKNKYKLLSTISKIVKHSSNKQLELYPEKGTKFVIRLQNKNINCY